MIWDNKEDCKLGLEQMFSFESSQKPLDMQINSIYQTAEFYEKRQLDIKIQLILHVQGQLICIK